MSLAGNGPAPGCCCWLPLEGGRENHHDTCYSRGTGQETSDAGLRPQEAKELGPALSITSRGPISEPSEVESGAHRAMQLDRGLALVLCALSASRAPLETFHHGTLPQHRGNSRAWHGHAALGNKSPQGESGYLPGQAIHEFQPLFYFSLSSSFPRLPGTQYARLQPPRLRES